MSAPTVRPRLIHLVPSDGCGGVEVAARHLASAPLDIDYRLLFLSGDTVAASALAARPASQTALAPRSVRAALRHIDDYDPDILLCSLWRSLPAGLLAKRRAPRRRLVVLLHSARRARWPDRLLHAAAFQAADAVWADSEASLSSAPVRPGQDRRCLSFLLSPPPLVAAPLPGPVFVSWGRLHPDKGMDIAVRFIARLRAIGLDATLDHWGPDQGARDPCETLARSLGLGAAVRFHGPVDHGALGRLADQATFFLQTSRQEGFGMAAAEAMQAGLVPVVTPVGALAEHSRHGHNAVWVDPADLAASVATVAALLENPDALARMRHHARNTFAGQPPLGEDLAAAARALMGGR